MSEISPNMTGQRLDHQSSRIWVTALVVAHLLVTFIASALDSRIHYHYQFGGYLHSVFPSNVADCLLSILASGMNGIVVGQIVLLTVWGAFADQQWLLRMPRFLTLVAWFTLFSFLGEYAIEGEVSKLLVEEKLAYALIQFLIPVIILCTFHLKFRRQFVRRDARQSEYRWQFNIRGLLLITAELAALLGLARVVLPRHFRFDQIWPALTELRNYELTPTAVTTTILPIVFFGLVRQRTWRAYLFLGLYLCVPVTVLTSLHLASVLRLVPNSADIWWWPEVYASFIGFWSVHLAAAATILVTFYLLRRIGYDFRRRDEGPRGRSSSSNACNSAASASA
jgi:hypothetical protein